MPLWPRTRRSLRTGVLVAFVVLAALLAAKIHACACTGGAPVWRPVSATN